MTNALQITEIPSCFTETRTKVAKCFEFLVSLQTGRSGHHRLWMGTLSPWPGASD